MKPKVDVWKPTRPYVSDDELIRIRDEAMRHRRAKTPPHPPDPLASHWRFVGPRNTSGRALCVAVHPTDANTLYVGSALGGLWRSTDGAESWWPLWKDQESLAVGAVAIAPSDPSIVYAGTGEAIDPETVLNTYPGAGLYVSIDAGTTWTIRAGVRSRRIAKIAVFDDPMHVVVAGNRGLERSRDGGVTWELLAPGYGYDIALDAHRPGRGYVAMAGDAVYRLDDNGLTYIDGPMVAELFTWPKLAIGVDGAHGSDFLLAQSRDLLFRTRDGGATWDRIDVPLLRNQPGYTDMLAVSPIDEDIIVIGHVDATRTTDGGATWHTVTGVHVDHHGVEFSRASSDIAYACTDGGLYRSSDAGATWRHASHGLAITQLYTLELWHRLQTVVVGGTQDNNACMSGGGMTWERLAGGDVSGIAIDPIDGRTIYALAQDGNFAFWRWPTAYASVTLPDIGSHFAGAVAQDPTRPDRIYVGEDAIAARIDGVWRLSSQSIANIRGIAIAPSDPDRVYAAGDGIIRSDDGGATLPWLDKTGSLPPFNAACVAVAPADRDRVAFGTFSGKLYLSENGGDTWTSIGDDVAAGAVNSIAFDPDARDTLYAGVDFGIWRTTDAGATWLPFDDGVPNAIITALRIAMPQRALYAATYGRGVYRRDLARPAPAVELYVRDHALDTAEQFPSPRGLPNPLQADGDVYPWESPDIKVDTAPWVERGRVFDGVELDALGYDGASAGVDSRVYMQVHNRGTRVARSVVVRVFAAGASAGLPRLAADFWAAFPEVDPAQLSAWHPIGPPRVIAELHPARPAIVEWMWTPPRVGSTHNCLLGLVTSADDTLRSTELDVNALVDSERRACLLNVNVIGVEDPPPPERTLSTVNFHNARYTRDLIDIVVDPRRPGVRIGLVLPHLSKVELVGVKRQPLAGKLPGRWPAGFSPDKLELDLSAIYECDPRRRSELRGIELAAGQALRAVVACSGKSLAVPEGAFAIMQRQDKRIIGGCSFEIRARAGESGRCRAGR